MIAKYNTNTQPLYVITDLEGNSLNVVKPTISYVGIEEYYLWLKEGIKKFKKARPSVKIETGDFKFQVK